MIRCLTQFNFSPLQTLSAVGMDQNTVSHSHSDRTYGYGHFFDDHSDLVNLVRVGLKETVGELISTADVSVAIDHLDLIIEETASLL